MTYDDWKTKDDQPEGEPKQETELELVYADLFHLRTSHDRLLATAHAALTVLENLPLGGDRDVNAALRAAIAAAEESSLHPPAPIDSEKANDRRQ